MRPVRSRQRAPLLLSQGLLSVCHWLCRKPSVSPSVSAVGAPFAAVFCRCLCVCVVAVFSRDIRRLVRCV